MSDNNFRKGPHASKSRVDVIDATASEVPAADERKTVVLDEDLEGVDFDDKVWLYWNRNKNFILFTIVAAFAIVIGIQGWKMYKANSASAISAAYEAAATPEALAAFAKEHAGTQLAGLALLQGADAAYASGKYADAQKLYSSASADLGGTVLFGRAKLGEAVSASSAGDAKGIDMLKAVYGNSSIAQSYRAQAGYLCGLALENAGKAEEAKKIFKEVSSNAANGAFANIAGEAASKLD